MRNKSLFILIASMLTLTTALANDIANGSFESNLSGWTTSLNNGVTADFSILTTDAQEGANSLEVNVTSSVQQAGSVVLKQSDVAVQSGNIYMLQFYAVADVQGAFLTVNIDGQQTNISREFKVWDRIKPTAKEWQMYFFLFKPSDNSVNIEITFDQQTRFLIDNFILFNDDANEYDLATQYMWQNNRKGYGWMSADNDVSVPLPDGRTAWIFSDTFLGNPDTTKNYLTEGTMINNLIVVQEGENNNELRTIYAGSQSSPRALFYPSSGGTVYWIADGIVEDGKLKILLNEWSALDFAGRAGVGVVSLPDLTVEELVVPSYQGSLIPNAILEGDGDYNYIYLEERPGGFSVFSSVARVPKGKLSDPTVAWEFFTDDNIWVTDESQAKRIVGAAVGSVMKLGTNNYVMSAVPHLSRELAVWYAPTPVGPWQHKTAVHQMPAEEGVLFYLGHIHEGTERDNGIFSMSYSLYPFGGRVAQQMADKGTYLPIYVEANLRELSPFTNADCAGVEGGAAYIDDCFQCVGGTTGLEPCDPNVALMDITDLEEGIITESNNNSPENENIQYLIDNNDNTKYLTFSPTTTILFEADATYALVRYSLTSANDFDDRDPYNWTLSGSVDGTDFEEIDIQNTQIFEERFQSKSFPVSPAQAYKYFKLEIEAKDETSEMTQLAELSLYGTIEVALDCAGVEDGSAYMDDCDQCVGGTTGLEPCSDEVVTGLLDAGADDRITVYPNPFTSQITIKTKYARDNISSVRILDLAGKVMIEQNVNYRSTVSIDGKRLPKGVYLLQVVDEHKKMYVFKIFNND